MDRDAVYSRRTRWKQVVTARTAVVHRRLVNHRKLVYSRRTRWYQGVNSRRARGNKKGEEQGVPRPWLDVAAEKAR